MAVLEKNTQRLTLGHDELEDMLNRAAERGALRALGNVGLEGKDAQTDIRELRSLLQALRFAKRTAWQTIIRIITTSFVLGLMATAAIKLKFFGDQ